MNKNSYRWQDIILSKRLLKYSKEYSKFLGLALLLVLLTAIIAPLRPYLLKGGIDTAIFNSDQVHLIEIASLVLLLTIFNSLFRYIMTYILESVGQKILAKIRFDVFSHILMLKVSYFDHNPSGKLVTRVSNDIEALNQLFSNSIVTIIADILLIISILVFMFLTDVNLTFYSLLILPLLLISTIIFKKKIRNVFRDLRSKLSDLNTFNSEHISGLETIKSFASEKFRFAKFKIINHDYFKLNEKSIVYYSFFFPIVELLAALALVIVLWYTGFNAINNVISIGTLVAFLQYSEMFFRPIRDLSEKISTLQSSFASAERIFEVLDTEIDEKLTQNSKEDEVISQLKFINLSFAYKEEQIVLKDINVTFEVGKKYGIVGATGSGKSTIVSILSGLYDNYQGSFWINNTNFKEVNYNKYLDKIALVQQDVYIFEGTLQENLFTDDLAKVEDFFSKSSLNQWYNNLKDKKISERGGNLSQGEKQIIALARAYLKNPDIIILDESTSNIDSILESSISDLIYTAFSNKIIIVVAHRLSTIKSCDQIIVLKSGKITEMGNHQDLISQNGIYQKFWSVQLLQNQTKHRA